MSGAAVASDVLADVLDRVGPVLRSGRGWRGACPCCDDGRRKRTLSLRAGERVPVLAWCFRCGARWPEIRAAFGIEAPVSERRPRRGPPVRLEPEHNTDHGRILAGLVAAEARRRALAINVEHRTRLRMAAAIHDHRDAAERWRALATRLATKLGATAGSVWDLLDVALLEDRDADAIEADLDARLVADRRPA